MHRVSEYLPKSVSRPARRIEDTVTESPGKTIVTAVAVAAAVGFLIWVWPEVRRTVRIHRM